MRNVLLPVASFSLLVFCTAGTLRAADAAPNKTPDKPTSADLENRIRDLEKRVRDLESELQSRPGASELLGQFRQRHNFGPDFDEFFNRFQRDLGQRWTGPGGALGANKPRLGVELAPPSDELRERFKNDVKDGAFVMDVVPGSAAEKGGVHVGDAVTAFNGKEISEPRDLIDAVRGAAQGSSEVTVTRRGESMKLKIELGAATDPEDTNFEQPQGRGGWLKREDIAPKNSTRSRTEVKTSELELNDDLAKSLSLNDDQRKKMTDILANEAKALNEDFAKNSTGVRGGARHRQNTFSYNSVNSDNVRNLVDKHVAAAEKELTGTLSADQMKKWADYRRTHSSLSVSQSTTVEEGGDVNTPHTGGSSGF